MGMGASMNGVECLNGRLTEKQERLTRTAQVLSESGLLDVTLQTADLLRKNQELQKDIDKLKEETQAFVESVLRNPENRWLRDIYEKRKGKDWNRQQTQMAPLTTNIRQNNQKRNR